MAIKRPPPTALGRGLAALIKGGEDRVKPRKQLEEEKRSSNMEFYRSLVKQYVQTGERDILTEQLLDNIRGHLDISDNEHHRLIEALRKEEPQLPRTSEGTKDQTQMEIKEDRSSPTILTEPSNIDDKEGTPPLTMIDPGISGIPGSPTGDKTLGRSSSENLVRVRISERRDPGEEECNAKMNGPPDGSGERAGVRGENMTDLTSRVDDDEPEEEWDEMEMEELQEDEGPESDDNLMSIRILMDEGKYQKALEISKRILENDPKNVSVLNECGVILYQLGRMSEAHDCYQRLMVTGEMSSESMINYAILLAEMGDLDRALSLLSEGIERDPYSEEGWNNKAVVLYKAGRLREALECLDEALRINENSAETWINTGIILERMEEYGPAMECYQKVLEMDPGNKLAREGLESCREMV
ncbi:MAG: tetratricopeptide repeat protein [Candidatus Thermoplasmatota archaeon]|nr:tetratricopeptide repeat protein [Candidatus Thermoplasmatota archaeon]